MPAEIAATLAVSGERSSLPSATRLPAGEVERDVGAGDRRAARAAVGRQHVAVEVDRALAERLEVDRDAQRAPDQALDLDRAPVELALGDVARLAVAGRRGQHPVLGRDPARAAAGHPARDALLHGCRADDARLALRDERRAGRGLDEVRLDRRRAQAVRRAPVRALARRGRGAHARASWGSATWSTVPIGSCRKRVPIVGERGGVAGAQEAVAALGVAVAPRRRQVAQRERVLDAAHDRGAGRDERDLRAEQALQQRADEGVVRAAEDHGVDAGRAQRRAVGARELDVLLGDRRAGLADLRELGARHARQAHERVGGQHGALVGAAGDGRGRREHADAPVARLRDGEVGLRPDDADDVDRVTALGDVQRQVARSRSTSRSCRR